MHMPFGMWVCVCIVFNFPLVFGSQEQSLLQPPTLQLLNGMGPLGRRASDGGANIQLHAQLLKRPRGPSPLVTSPVRTSSCACALPSVALSSRGADSVICLCSTPSLQWLLWMRKVPMVSQTKKQCRGNQQ